MSGSQDQDQDCFEGLDLQNTWVQESCRLNCVHHPEKAFKYVNSFGCRHIMTRLSFRLGYTQDDSFVKEDLELASILPQDVDAYHAQVMYEIFLSSGDYAWIRRLADVANTTDNMEVIKFVDTIMRRLQRKDIVSNMDGAQPLCAPRFMFHFGKRLANQIERERLTREYHDERARVWEEQQQQLQLRQQRPVCAIL